MNKTDVLKALLPCPICKAARVTLRESIDFQDGTTQNLYQVVCPHRVQKPRRWADLKTSWSADAAVLLEQWNHELPR